MRVYVEGGGDGGNTKARFRTGFSRFFCTLRDAARERKIGWQVIACGSRSNAYDAFQVARQTRSDAFIILLVDSEGPVKANATPWVHLRSTDDWSSRGADDAQCHLMVQTMEAWLIADVEALAGFYGSKFHRNAIPKRKNVEQIPKDDLLPKLQKATRDTPNGKYHKTRHAPKLLERLDADKVRSRAPHLNRLFTMLETKLGDRPPGERSLDLFWSA